MDSDDDFYSDDDAVDIEQEYFDNDPEDSDYSKQQNYVVLSEADIRQRQEDDITALSSLLSVTRADCAILLGHYNWSVSKVHEEWFADEERVRKAVGLFSYPKPVFGGVEILTCGICFDTFAKGEIYDAACGHPFCGVCWGGYISSSINDGPGCLTLQCPDPSCSAAVGRDMINALVVSEDDRKKYARHLLRSYVEDNKKTKWCPAPGCDYAVDFVVGSNFDVICGCSYGFCWNCTEEAHRPADCGTVKEWITKNSSESENTNWILANSKPCPKCKRPIEKNNGCMHMTCRQPCRFEFCWLCLGAWSDHRGSYACNRYKTSERDEDERRREMAKKSLQRYAHYYERWAANEKSRQKAVADLEQMEKVHLGKLIEVQCESEAQLKFLVEAWSQIVECRRVLKWTYAYGYYLPEHESAKRQLFEYLQGQAEAGLERLHQCAENELQGHLTTEQGPSDDFNKFRTKLADLTSVTQNYFENLVRALENGLSELDSHSTAGSQARGSKAKTEGGGGSDRVGQKRMRHEPDIKTSTSRGLSMGVANDIIAIDDDDDDDDDDLNYWPCDRCTYLNDSSTTACRMCNQ